jgi:C1A family cysteine protease
MARLIELFAMHIIRHLIGLVGFGFLLSSFYGGMPLPVVAQVSDEVIWNIEVDLNISAEQTERIAGIKLESGTYSFDSANKSASTLNVQGSGTFDGLRQVLFAEMTPEFYLLGGPAEFTIAGHFNSEESIVLVLETIPSSGYYWQLTPDSLFWETESTTFEPKATGRGLPELQTMYLAAPQGGADQLKLVYRRASNIEESSTRRILIQASEIPDVIDLSDPLPLSDFTGFAEIPVPIQPELTEAPTSIRGALPSSFDAREYDWVPAIRNQGSCGSCWAFGTVGVMEIAMKKSAGITADLSEQFLISCNNNGWSCTGGLTASMYHYNTLGKLQAGVGAVTEADMPYTQSNGVCAPKDHPYVLSGWHYANAACGDTPASCEFAMPTVEEIKWAIYNYGAVTAGVRVGTNWYAYTGGIQTASDSGATNHQIVIVGWNDSGGYWIVRNQWGASDGEAGYRRMAYGISRLGEGASYDIYSPLMPAVNDEIDVAEVINYDGGAVSQVFNVETGGSTISAGDPVVTKKIGRGSHSVWYSFYPAGNGTLKLSTAGSNYDTVLILYSGSPDSLKKVTYHDNRSTKNKTSVITYKNIKANTQYYIEVVGKGAGGILELAVTYNPRKPTYGRFSAAKALPQNMTSAVLRLDVEKTGIEKIDKRVFDVGPDRQIYHTVWYKFRPYKNGILHISVNSNYSNAISLKNKNGWELLIPPNGNDPWTASVNLEGGKQYWIGSGSLDGDTSAHIMNVTLTYVPDA